MRARDITEAADLTWTSLPELSPQALCAIVGAEDPVFFQHHGVAWSLLARRLIRSIGSAWRVAGVSTISQQLARNLYLYENRSLARKVAETMLAYRLEHHLGKRRILELYVNLVEWGSGLWGIAAAARHYFDVAPNELNAFQSVVLASLLPAPRAVLTGGNLQRATSSQCAQLHFLYAAGVITVPEWRETQMRIGGLAQVLASGAYVLGAMHSIGGLPYLEVDAADSPPSVEELLQSQCGLTLRTAYTDLLDRGVPIHCALENLPHRWTGRLLLSSPL